MEFHSGIVIDECCQTMNQAQSIDAIIWCCLPLSDLNRGGGEGGGSKVLIYIQDTTTNILFTRDLFILGESIYVKTWSKNVTFSKIAKK